MSADLADWTIGTEALLYQRCRSCRSVWYFRRGFCPSCGAADVETLPSQGKGVVHAATLPWVASPMAGVERRMLDWHRASVPRGARPAA